MTHDCLLRRRDLRCLFSVACLNHSRIQSYASLTLQISLQLLWYTVSPVVRLYRTLERTPQVLGGASECASTRTSTVLEEARELE